MNLAGYSGPGSRERGRELRGMGGSPGAGGGGGVALGPELEGTGPRSWGEMPS